MRVAAQPAERGGAFAAVVLVTALIIVGVVSAAVAGPLWAGLVGAVGALAGHYPMAFSGVPTVMFPTLLAVLLMMASWPSLLITLFGLISIQGTEQLNILWNRAAVNRTLENLGDARRMEIYTTQALSRVNQQTYSTIMRVAHDVLHIRFEDGEIYPRITSSRGGVLGTLQDMPRLIASWRHRNKTMWIKATPNENWGKTSYCQEQPDPFDNTWNAAMETEAIKGMTRVLRTLFRLILMLRSSVLSNDAHARSDTDDRCIAKWKRLMRSQTAAVVSGHATGIHRAAFLYVWGDFLVLQTTVKKHVEHVRVAEQRDDQVSALAQHAGQAVLQADTQLWFAGGRYSKCDPARHVRLDVQSAIKSGDVSPDQCLRDGLIFLAMLWTEARRLQINAISEKDRLEYTIQLDEPSFFACTGKDAATSREGRHGSILEEASDPFNELPRYSGDFA